MSHTQALSFSYYLLFLVFAINHLNPPKILIMFWAPFARFAIEVSSVFATITILAYLIYCGWTIHWWVPLVVTTTCMTIAAIVYDFMRRYVGFLGYLIPCLTAFIAWPVCAYAMFHYIFLKT